MAEDFEGPIEDDKNNLMLEVMRSSTKLKLQQIEERNTLLQNQHKTVYDHIDKLTGRDRLQYLANYLTVGIDKANLTSEAQQAAHFLEQTRLDPATDESEYKHWSDLILLSLAAGRKRYEYAYLYSCLLMEWGENRPKPEFQSHLPSAFIKYLNPDMSSVDRHNALYFGSAQNLPSAAKQLLHNSARFAEIFHVAFDPETSQYTHPANFFAPSMMSTFTTDVSEAINIVISSDLLLPSQCASLVAMNAQPQLVKDLASSFAVLLENIESWSWSKPAYLEVRPDAGGKYRSFIVPDLFQLIFVTCISKKLAFYYTQFYCVIFLNLRKQLLAQDRPALAPGTPIPPDYNTAVSLFQAIFDSFSLVMLRPPPPAATASSSYSSSTTPSASDRNGNSISAMTERILQEISVQKTLRFALQPDSEFHVVHIDFEAFGASIPHAVINELLQLFNVPAPMVALIKGFLALQVLVDGEAKPLSRGLPNAIHMSKLLGEMLLSCLDLYVLRQAGLRMCRIYDDVWIFDHSPKRVAAAVKAVKEFSQACGLSFNPKKTGYVFMPGPQCRSSPLKLDLPNNPIGFGFLEIGPQHTTIQTSKVEAFARLVKEDLADAASLSVIEWAKRFNRNLALFESSCGAHFAAYAPDIWDRRFAALDLYFSIVLDHTGPSSSTSSPKDFSPKDFSSSSSSPASPTPNATTHLVTSVQKLIQSRSYGSSISGNVSVPWIFMPITAGGLGLRNPYLELHAFLSSYLSCQRVLQAFDGAASELAEYDSMKAAHDQQALAIKQSTGVSPSAFRTFKNYQLWRYHESRQYVISLNSHARAIPCASDPPTPISFGGRLNFTQDMADFSQRGAKMFEGNFGTLSRYWTLVVWRYLPMLRNDFGSVAFLDTSLIPYGLIASLNKGAT